MKFVLHPDVKLLMLRHEGLNQPGFHPGGDSGITIGYGYDLAHHTKEELERDWAGFLAPNQMKRLATVIGKSGIDARATAGKLTDIRVKRIHALEVFEKVSVPKYWKQTKKAFPGVEKLHPRAQGALLSLVYNRGPSLGDFNTPDDRRQDMEDIHNILKDGVQAGDYQMIADQLREMKELWKGKGLGGLIERREDEAVLVESCIGEQNELDSPEFPDSGQQPDQS